jgi:hypothetical protein
VTKDDGTVFATNFVKDNLAAFTYSPATATFLPASSLQTIDVERISRVITASPIGEIASSDTYRILSKSQASYGSFELSLPLSASNIVARDEFGRALTVEFLRSSGNIQVFNVTFISSLSSGESTSLTAEYTLPRVSPEQTRFTLNFDLFPYFNYYADEVSVTIDPPEGARFIMPQLSQIDPSLSVTRGIFQDTLSISREGVSYVDQVIPSENALQIAYDYNLLWLSFRPTLWAWVLAVAGCIILAVYRRPKPSAPLRIEAPKLPTVTITSDTLRTFTEAYEEKSRITSELKLLDARAQKGKIPRRRYKVQRRTLEVRSEALSKNIAELKRAFRSGGGLYADLIRQLGIAETELDEVETEIGSVEARHGRGELSLEEYKKFVADYQRRKEKAETTINGILLRLREEIR